MTPLDRRRGERATWGAQEAQSQSTLRSGGVRPLVMGIVCGLPGAIAVLCVGPIVKDMPRFVTEDGPSCTDVHAFYDLINQTKSDHVFIEQPHLITDANFQTVTSILTDIRVPVTEISASLWRHTLHVKDDVRARALVLLPKLADQWPLEEQHVKAALIALYGSQNPTNPI
jgi:hypothetical protein